MLSLTTNAADGYLFLKEKQLHILYKRWYVYDENCTSRCIVVLWQDWCIVGEKTARDAREDREGIRGQGDYGSLQLLIGQVIFLSERLSEREASGRPVNSLPVAMASPTAYQTSGVNVSVTSRLKRATCRQWCPQWVNHTLCCEPWENTEHGVFCCIYVCLHLVMNGCIFKVCHVATSCLLTDTFSVYVLV